MAANDSPKTLLEATRHYADLNVCQDELVAARWPDGVTCPHCGSKDVAYLANQRRWQCKGKHPRRQFSAKVGTIFEDSPIKLDKWFVAIWLISSAKNGISSYELAKSIGVTQKSAWFMLHRIRLAMQTRSFEKKLEGEVEADETFIGGRAKFMHAWKRKGITKGRSTGVRGKVAVFALLERHGQEGQSKVRAVVVPNTRRNELQQHIRTNVVTDGTATLYTDAYTAYQPTTPRGWRPSDLYIHKFIDHAERYVDGQIHTNGCENFWSLLKRGLKGTYISVEPFHLFRYVDEQAYRFNTRKQTDASRFVQMTKRV
ncbi:MAG: IS1595 family transposase, partial [Luteitalea sp.]|nr:IS1595 family transposase [Luteitalea sp.]